MKRLAIATAVFCALALPAVAVSATDGGNNQTVSITVSKAIEADAGSTIALGSQSPSGASNVNVDSGSQTAVTLRSNAAWTATVAASAATMGENDARTTGSLTNSLYYSNSGTPTVSAENIVPTSATQAATGSRNSNNNTQSYSLFFRQPISWADEAGDYAVTLTHALSN